MRIQSRATRDGRRSTRDLLDLIEKSETSSVCLCEWRGHDAWVDNDRGDGEAGEGRKMVVLFRLQNRNPPAQGIERRLGPIGKLEFVENIADVGAYGALAYRQSLGNILIG